MNIVVLLKQVPDTESLLEIADSGAEIKTDDVKWVVNPYDELAVEEALQIKEKSGEGKVTVLCVGPQRADAAIRTAYAMGADEGIRIDDPGLAAADAVAVARTLTAALKQIPHDLIIAGQRAVDDDNYLVPAVVAEALDIPLVPMIVNQEIANGKITCEQVIQGGTLVVETALPAVITTQRGLNEPRYATMPKIMKAKKKPIDVRGLADIGAEIVDGVKMTVKSLSGPPRRKAGKVLDGDSVAAKAAQLVKLLHEEAEVI